MKPKVSKRKEIIEIRTEINEINCRKTDKINETKSCFFEKINKIEIFVQTDQEKMRKQKLPISRMGKVMSQQILKALK